MGAVVPFSPLRFQQYAADLERAVFKMSQERDRTRPMSDMSEPLRGKPGPGPSPFLRSESTNMSITGLQQGAFQSKLAEMRAKVASVQTAGLAEIDGVVTAGVAKLEEAAKGAATKAQSEIDNALQEFATMTNGGPA